MWERIPVISLSNTGSELESVRLDGNLHRSNLNTGYRQPILTGIPSSPGAIQASLF